MARWLQLAPFTPSGIVRRSKVFWVSRTVYFIAVSRYLLLILSQIELLEFGTETLSGGNFTAETRLMGEIVCFYIIFLIQLLVP